MKTVLKMSQILFDDLLAHLLPEDDRREQAAFLIARVTSAKNHADLEALDAIKLIGRDFESQENDYLELSDATRARVIKAAHDQHASLVEVHSHPGNWPAAFSPSDISGLRETVPHMWWRLAKRPYVAIVVSRSGFDALAWVDTPQAPRALDCLLVGDKTLHPTHYSLRGWR